jgi:uncharacterized protein YecE (DUF72 family)
MARQLFVGTSGWNYPDWRGRFYPDGLQPRRFLSYYATQFRTTELNYSFYHLPKPETFQNWAGQVPEGFVLAVKANRHITHLKRLRDVTETWQTFLGNASGLGEHLGPVLLQLPPSFTANLEVLEGFLRGSRRLARKHKVRLAFEFRHQTWFEDPVFDILRQYEASPVIAQSRRYPQSPPVTTASFVYLRFHGPEDLFASAYSLEDLEAWAMRIRSWLSERRSVYAYFNNDWHGYAVENARTLISLLEA